MDKPESENIEGKPKEERNEDEVPTEGHKRTTRQTIFYDSELVNEGKNGKPAEEGAKLTEEFEKTIRRMIFHEDELVNSRMSWLLTLEGFLFAALGFAWDKDHTRCLAVLLSIVGIVVALSGGVMLYCSNQAVIKLYGKWRKKKKKETDYQGAGVVGFWGARRPFLSLFQPPKVYPPLLAMAWLVVLLTHVGHCFWDLGTGKTADSLMPLSSAGKTEYRIAVDQEMMRSLQRGDTLVIHSPKPGVSIVQIITDTKDSDPH
jgi:hypothetical protein